MIDNVPIKGIENISQMEKDIISGQKDYSIK